MLIDDIVARIDEGGPKSYYSFETFVLNLLKHHLSLEGKSLEPISDRGSLGDAIAPEGIDDIEGPVLFEIKFNPPRDTKVYKDLWTSKVFNYLRQCSNERFPKRIIFISAKPLSKNFKQVMPSGVGVRNGAVEVTYWGPEEINKIVSRHRAKASEIVNNLFSLRLEAAVKHLRLIGVLVERRLSRN